MHRLVRIDSSSRGPGSVSRALGDHVENVMRSRIHSVNITRRDLVAAPIPHISDATIAGYYAAPDVMTDNLREATAMSDQLIAELMEADTLLITVPMYNFSVPSALKAWIDQIVRIGRTFSYDGSSFAGLVKGKRAIVVCSCGASGYGANDPLAAANFVEPYLRFLLGFIGFEEVDVVAVEATTAAADLVAQNIETARAKIDGLFAYS